MAHDSQALTLTPQTPDEATDWIVECPATKKRVSFRAAKLCKLFSLPRDHADDLEQDCWHKIIAAFRGYTTDRGHPRPFAKSVADMWYCETARSLHNARKPPQPIPPSVAQSIADAQRIDVSEQAGLSPEMELALHRLPRDVERVVRLVTQTSGAGAASELGLNPGTVSRKYRKGIEQLKQLIGVA